MVAAQYGTPSQLQFENIAHPHAGMCSACVCNMTMHQHVHAYLQSMQGLQMIVLGTGVCNSAGTKSCCYLVLIWHRAREASADASKLWQSLTWEAIAQ